MSANTLTIVKNQNGDSLHVNFIGQIDAGADYSDITFDGVKTARFNLKGINLINSAGIQKWVKFMSAIPDGIDITFEECPSSIVNQINLFANFTGGKKVEYLSFVGPFFCEDCDEEHDVLLTPAQILSEDHVELPTPPCPTCSKEMEFDAIEEKYFSFIQKK